MSKFSIIRRQQLLREAEGYVDLILALSDRWPPRKANRVRVAQRALDILEELEACRWRKGEVAFLKGLALKSMDRFADAVPPLQMAALLDSDNYRILLALAWCQKRCGRLDQAIRALEQGLAIDGEQPILHYNLACYWSLADRPTRALKYLAQALDMEPDYRPLIADERDFDPIRDNPEFQTLISVNV